MKLTFHVPTQQYGFLEIEGTEEDRKEMEMLYNTYAENKLPFKTGNFIEIDTFTGEKIRYDEENHIYEDLAGNRLVGGSTYAESKVKPFDKEMILPKVAKKLGVDAGIIDAMWNGGGFISRTFGTAIHAVMEQWFRYKEHGTEYHLPKHPFLRNVIETYPRRDSTILPEVFVSSVKHRMVGQIDGLEIVDAEKKICNIIDFKSDADVKKNLEKHSYQLSFYAMILEKHGWTVEHLYIDNYTTAWTTTEVARMEIK
jgi:hypothetical protein